MRRTRYINQWTLIRDARVITAALAVWASLFLYYLIGKADIELLRGLLTIAIMSMPSLVGVGYWLGTAQTRGYQQGVKEKQERRQQPPMVIEMPGYPPALGPGGVTHQELINDVSTG